MTAIDQEPVTAKPELMRLVFRDTGREVLTNAYPFLDGSGRRLKAASREPGNEADLLLAAGWLSVARPFPEAHKRQPPRGQPRECRQNSLDLARSQPSRCHMVYGLSGQVHGDLLLVIAHAWCVDPRRRRLDPPIDAELLPVHLGVPVPHAVLPELEEDLSPLSVLLGAGRYWSAFDLWTRESSRGGRL